MKVNERSNQKSDIYPPQNEFTEDEKYHNLMSWLIHTVCHPNCVISRLWSTCASRSMTLLGRMSITLSFLENQLAEPYISTNSSSNPQDDNVFIITLMHVNRLDLTFADT